MSGGAPRRPIEHPKPPGYGQKCFPAIEGIEERFKAEKPVPKEAYNEQVGGGISWTFTLLLIKSLIDSVALCTFS